MCVHIILGERKQAPLVNNAAACRTGGDSELSRAANGPRRSIMLQHVRLLGHVTQQFGRKGRVSRSLVCQATIYSKIMARRI